MITNALACTVEDTSHLDGAGDRFVSTADGLRMLQETKAKERLNAKTDLERFRADVSRGAAAGRVNAGLFVSLKTRTLPNAGQYAVEWLSVEAPAVDSPAAAAGERSWRQVPIVMIASASRDAIALAAQTTHWLCMRARDAEAVAASAADNQSDESRALHAERRALADALPPIFSRIEMSAAEIDERLRLLRKLLELAEADKARHASVETLIERLSAAVPFVCAPRAAEAAGREAAVGIVVDFMRANGGSAPKLTQLSAAQRQAVAAAGGISAVRQAARDALKGGLYTARSGLVRPV